MQPLTREWLDKAEGDFMTAQRELRARKLPNYDAACFHAQQCVEKYLKARLQEANVAFTRTHNLVALLDLCLPIEPYWEALRSPLQILTLYAVNVRYPGEVADKDTAREAIRLCRLVREQARQSLEIG